MSWIAMASSRMFGPSLPPTRFMPSDQEAVRRWLDDIRHHVAMAQIFAAGMS
jgi:hypothetical protein